MTINLNLNALALLGLTRSELNDLPEEEARSKIQKAWRKKALQYHSDHNQSADANAQFHKITQARDVLLGKETTRAELDKPSDTHPINQYFTKLEIKLSNTDFDLRMRDRIAQSYQELLQEFVLLRTESEKKVFAQENAAFITLAQTLLTKQHDIIHHWDNWKNRGLWSVLIHEWRSEIISVFGEEFLDDFDYRHALATGELYPILATRKLFSPIKLALALAQSTVIPIRVLFNYASEALMRCYADENYIPIIAAILGSILALIYLPSVVQLFLAANFLERLLHILATPVNTLIRPLAQFTSVAPEFLTFGAAAFGVGGAALAAVAFSSISFSLTAAILSLVWAYRALLALQVYWNITPGIHYLNENQEGIGSVFLINAAFSLVDLAVSLIFDAWFSLNGFSDGYSLEEIFSGCLALVADTFLWTGVAYQVVNSMEHAAESETRMMQSAPLPDSPVSAATKEAARQRVVTGDYSNQFFNTPIQANCLQESERTLWQKTCSFFGGGAKNPERKTAPEFRESETVPAIPLLL